ncbi:MAG TPA: MFS transporter [Bacteroidetes bacterium]|nr:MFS transporter [Bacteroidota bacterium]
MAPAYKLMLISWVCVAAWIAFVIISNKKIHPKALFALFMVELWERFSYYGMRALLVLYMIAKISSEYDGGFGFTDAEAFGVYGAYGALVYLTPIIGGYFADKMMGFRKAITWGALLMAAGQFTLFMDNQTTFFLGLALLVVGNGFFKPNISSMIGRFYPEGDPRRDGAFTIFYMGINIGAFLAPLTCGVIGEIEGWKYGFLAAGIGMFVGYLIFLWAQSKGIYEENGLPPANIDEVKVAGIGGKIFPYVATLILIPLVWILVIQNDVVDVLLVIVGGGILIYLLFIVAPTYEKKYKERIWVIVLLLFFTTVFWTFFELAGSALNVFTARNVDRHILGFEAQTTLFQSVNPLFIMIFAPIYSWMWIKLAKSGKEPAAPYKFGVGLILLGCGFLVLKLGGVSAAAGLVPAFFLILLYLLHTLGELTLSPVGLSLVTKLAPMKIAGFLMGIWFLSSSIAHQAGKHIAKLMAVDEAKVVASASFQGCLKNQEIKEALKADFFQNWLKDNQEIKAGESNPCEGLTGDELTLCQKKHSLDDGLANPAFAGYLNKQVGNTKYYSAKLQIKELKEKAEKVKNPRAREKEMSKSFVTFLTTNPDYAAPAGNAPVKVMPKADVEKAAANSSSGTVIQCLRQDTLKLALSVFANLGFIAIGCGVLLFILGPMISRWMHGIK